MAVEMFSWPSLHGKMCRTWGSNSGPLACQADTLPIELPRSVLPEHKRRFIAQSLSCSPFHRLEMTEILLKGWKTLTHPSILKLFTYAVLPSFFDPVFIVQFFTNRVHKRHEWSPKFTNRVLFSQIESNTIIHRVNVCTAPHHTALGKIQYYTNGNYRTLPSMFPFVPDFAE